MDVQLNEEQQQQAAKAGEGRGKGAMRQLMAFIGGIDLCDGRYDTPEHSLFKTLDTTHTAPDFCECRLVVLSRICCQRCAACRSPVHTIAAATCAMRVHLQQQPRQIEKRKLVCPAVYNCAPLSNTANLFYLAEESVRQTVLCADACLTACTAACRPAVHSRI